MQKKKFKFKFKSVVALANNKLSVKSAAIILASSTLVSALLGIFRDRLLNSYYLHTYPTGTDAYTVAFIIPDFMFLLLTSGALSVSFIPVFNQKMGNGRKADAWELSSSLLNFLALITLATSVGIMIFAKPLVHIVGPGLDESSTILAINMMRVIAINPFLFSVSTILSSIQQALGRFVFYALAPALYNVGILVGITVFTGGISIFGVQVFEGGIMGVAIGVVFGAVLQLIVSLIGLFGLGFDYHFKINWRNRGFRSILKLLPARSLDQGIDYVNNIVSTSLSSHMGAGTLRSFQQASSLHQMPVSLIGVAISTAFFPKLTEELGEGKDDQINRTFQLALRAIIWISLPVSVIAFFARGYVVSFIVNGGNALIASILASFIIAIFAQSVFHIASRGFYAYQDTHTPLVVSIVSIGLTIFMSILFAKLGYGPEGLGWAQSLGAVLEIVILLFILNRRSSGKILNRAFWQTMKKMLYAGIVTSCVAYAMTKFFPLKATDISIVATFPKFCLIALVSSIAYLLASFFLSLEEADQIIQKLKKIVFRNVE